jgi:hypothetical protein
MKNFIKFFCTYFFTLLLKPLGLLGLHQHPAAHGVLGLIVGCITCKMVTRRNLPNNILNGNIILPLGIVGIFGKVFSLINGGWIDILDVDIKWIIIFVMVGAAITLLLDNLNNKDPTPKTDTKTQTAALGSGSGSGDSGDSSEDNEKPKSRWERIKKFYWNHQHEIHAIAFAIVAIVVFGCFRKDEPKDPKNPNEETKDPKKPKKGAKYQRSNVKKYPQYKASSSLPNQLSSQIPEFSWYPDEKTKHQEVFAKLEIYFNTREGSWN